MAEGEQDIVICYACGAPMNIAAHPPYSRVVCPSCQTENRVKKQFGSYVVNRRHAIGGMSSVFIATDSILNREVALKILSEEYSSDEKRIVAFEQEARLTASFSHPNVVSVFTTGKAFGRLFIAMEFVPGGHFEHHIRERGYIPETEALPLAIQVAEGLKGAQAAGLIHRDVKPGNILLDSEGNAKLVDFGLALVTKAGKAKAEEIWATPYYVPPEAIEGGVEDFRSDIYAFGATFYHALAGKPPCNEESLATELLREAKKRIEPLSKAAPALTAETCALIDRAMSFDPINRFYSYDQMIDALQTALKVANGELVRDSDGVTKSQKRLELRRSKQRNIFLGSAAAAAVCLFAVGAVIFMKSKTVELPANPKPSVMTVRKAQSGGADHLHQIAEIYRTARAAMEQGELSKAETHLAALLQNSEVQEPTRTWAGLEAVVMAMMDGRMSDASKHASSVREHIKQSKATTTSEFQTEVLPVLNKLLEHPFIDASDINLPSKSSEAHMASLMAGLKNWEQGGFEQALPFLRALSSDAELSEDNVLAWYQKVVRSYLRDYQKLKSSTLQVDPKTPVACREAIQELSELLTLLETKGRARFNVRARQNDLALLERTLSIPKRPDPDTQSVSQAGEKLLRDIHFLAKGFRFQEIIAKLNEFEGDPPGCKRDSLLVVSQASQNFLTEIEADLRKGAVDLPLTLKDGTAVVSLVIKDDTFYSKLQDGEIREIRWMDLAAEEILKLNAELMKYLNAEEDQTQRNESAIAFDWLSGDRNRAIAAAESLADQGENFKNRWDAISPGLPK